MEIRVIVLNPNGGVEVKNIERSLDAYYAEIGCSLVDIVTRSIDGKEYSIILDDEGALREKPNVSAVWSSTANAALVGTLIVCNTKYTDDGLIEDSLTNDDIQTIFGRVIPCFLDGRISHVLALD